ncbi:hypothetical protein CPB86DRAFT_500334 [Serendipita vermifera]|nr:hypothetical protein CPB86DRAFT_500334 [Serendipita vermifera]
MHQPALVSFLSLSLLYLTGKCSAQELTPTPDVLEFRTAVPSNESTTPDGSIAENNISDSTNSAVSECPTGGLELLPGFTSDFPSSDPGPEVTSDPFSAIFSINTSTLPSPEIVPSSPLDSPTTTRWGSGELVTAASTNLRNVETASPTPSLNLPALGSFNTLGRTLPGAPIFTPTPTPLPTPLSIRIATPIPGTAIVVVPNIVGAPITSNLATPITNTPRVSGANNPANSLGNTLHSSIPVAKDTPQGQSDDEFPLTWVSVGASTTLMVVTEVTSGIDSRSTSRTSMMSETQSSIGPPATPGHRLNSSTVPDELSPAAIGAIVGSLLGALTLWILLVVWLKRRKKAQDFW